jgi:hypothetical protein
LIYFLEGPKGLVKDITFQLRVWLPGTSTVITQDTSAKCRSAHTTTNNNNRHHFLLNMFGGEEAPLVHNPMLDILLGDVKNERGENEEGIVTLGEIAAEMGFENRQVLAHPPSAVSSPLHGLVRGRYARSFLPMVITFRRRTIRTVFLVETGATATFIGKPTWDRLMEGC